MEIWRYEGWGLVAGGVFSALSLIFIHLGSVLQFLDWVYVVGLLRLFRECSVPRLHPLPTDAANDCVDISSTRFAIEAHSDRRV